MDQDHVYRGERGYVTLTSAEHEGRHGLLLRYVNPDARKLHTLDAVGIAELSEAIDEVERLCYTEDPPSFLILHGAYDPLHAGADVTQFDGEPDYEAIRALLHDGVEVDTRIKALWPRLRTVGLLCGNRYGGSVEWPLFAEFGVCDSATRIQLSEVHLGILPGWNGILNVMLKSNPSNAQYMATTGNMVDAEQMQRMGLVQSVVPVGAAPDRKLTPPGEYAAAWQEHAETAHQALLEAGLELAVAESVPPLGRAFQLADAEEYVAEIARRTQDTEYAGLRQSAADRLASYGDDADAEEALRVVGKLISEELRLLGKPLAPEAVNLATRFVKQFGALSREELLARFGELGRIEADLCVECLKHPHGRIGVRAMLSKDPLERVPIFAEVDYSVEGRVF